MKTLEDIKTEYGDDECEMLNALIKKYPESPEWLYELTTSFYRRKGEEKILKEIKESKSIEEYATMLDPINWHSHSLVEGPDFSEEEKNSALRLYMESKINEGYEFRSAKGDINEKGHMVIENALTPFAFKELQRDGKTITSYPVMDAEGQFMVMELPDFHEGYFFAYLAWTRINDGEWFISKMR